MSYKTKFGPCFWFPCAVYANNDIGLSMGIRRITGIRKPLIPGYDAALRSNQFHWFRRPEIKEFTLTLRELFESYFASWTTIQQECIEHYQDPHEKRDLRISGFDSLNERGELYQPSWNCPYNPVRVKNKSQENSKFEKKIRTIGDLGVERSLRGFRMTHHLKTAQSAYWIPLPSGSVVFCKSPSKAELSEVMDELIHLRRGDFFMVVFSDDSCCSVRILGKVYTFNVDIKSCDSSHTDALFHNYRDVFPERMHVEVATLLNQCHRDITIDSRSHKKNKVTILIHSYTLLSGSTITTSLNNHGSFNLAYAISEATMHLTSGVGLIDVIKRACSMVGYMITIQECTGEPQRIQFLKNSPHLCNGEWKPVFNIGALLRLSGSCNGDLPGRGDVSVRALAFQAALLKGAYPRTTFSLLTLMKSMCGCPIVSDKTQKAIDKHVAKILDYHAVGTVEDEIVHVTDEEICLRYRLHTSEWSELLQLVKHAGNGFGSTIRCSATAKIYYLDYGYVDPFYADELRQLD